MVIRKNARGLSTRPMHCYDGVDGWILDAWLPERSTSEPETHPRPDFLCVGPPGCGPFVFSRARDARSSGHCAGRYLARYTPRACSRSADAATAAPAAATKTVPLAKPVIVPYDLQAYQVSITLGIAPGIGISDQKVDASRGCLPPHRIPDRQVWQADIGLAPTSEPRSQAMLNSISLAAWNERMATSTADKRFALVVDRDGTAFRLSVLEWDRASQTITQIQTRSTYDHRLLPHWLPI